jgi:membrane protein required for colicin V production
MNWIDIVILTILGLSTLFSLLRGFVREALSLIIWMTAFWVALFFSPQMELFLAEWITEPVINKLAAFSSLFVLTLLVGALVGYFATLLVKKTGLTGTDRMIGMIFGISRGAVIVAAIMMLAHKTTLPQSDVWKDAMFVEYFDPLSTWLNELVSEKLPRFSPPESPKS